MVIFDTKNMKNGHFRQFPLGLDRDLVHFCQLCPTVVPLVVQWCQKCHFVEKPLGLDRGFSHFVEKPLILVFFSDFRDFAEKSHPSGFG